MQDGGRVRLGLVGLGGWGDHIALAAARAGKHRLGTNPMATSEECIGGPLMQLGVHHVDTLQYRLGPIAQVRGWQRKAQVRTEIDDMPGTLQEEVAEFVECIRTGKPPEIAGEAGLRDAAVVLAAVESGRTGKAFYVEGILA